MKRRMLFVLWLSLALTVGAGRGWAEEKIAVMDGRKVWKEFKKARSWRQPCAPR